MDKKLESSLPLLMVTLKSCPMVDEGPSSGSNCPETLFLEMVNPITRIMLSSFTVVNTCNSSMPIRTIISKNVSRSETSLVNSRNTRSRINHLMLLLDTRPSPNSPSLSSVLESTFSPRTLVSWEISLLERNKRLVLWLLGLYRTLVESSITVM